ncbi:MAG: 2-oxoacid:acceptor oxidoreductase subunit alpha [Candidatus Lernaella stagnicola]|nr:2-oxoacid:acceptor oxidoreductase subunit alpha [Candidatus Lernaella stagnicola]
MAGPKFKTGLRLMSGNEAIAEAALYAGCRMFAGYPITPSTEIAEILSCRLPQVGGFFLQMEDEIAAMAAILGGSLAGAKTMTATSGPGFSLKQENIGYGCLAEIPCVVVNVQRGGPSTGVPTGPSQGDLMQARWGTHGDHPIIALYPNGVEDLFWETIRAFNLAERYRTPVLLMSDEVIGHMRERMFLPSPGTVSVYNRRKPRRMPDRYFAYQSGATDVPTMAPFGEGYRFHVTGLFHDRSGFPTNDPAVIETETRRLLRKIHRAYNDIVKWEEVFLDDAEEVIVCFGCVSRSALAAAKRLRKRDHKVGLFRIKTLWPFPTRALAKIAQRKHVKKMLVPEMNAGQIVAEVERAAGQRCEVLGLQRLDTQIITPRQIMRALRES